MTEIFNKTETKRLRRMLRNNMPEAEVILWSRLKGKQVLGCKFRRQYGVESYSIDFYSPEVHLAVEVDGESHFRGGAEENDRVRQRLIVQYKITFLRFTNDDVRTNINGIVAAIEEKIKELREKPPAT